jgi:hypothetical protein
MHIGFSQWLLVSRQFCIGSCRVSRPESEKEIRDRRDQVGAGEGQEQGSGRRGTGQIRRKVGAGEGQVKFQSIVAPSAVGSKVVSNRVISALAYDPNA